MRRHRSEASQPMNLDSLVDIVSNNVGILIILAAFMALMALLNPASDAHTGVQPSVAPPPRLLVPWTHPTTKNHVLLSMQGNRIQVLDLRKLFRDLSERGSGPPQPLTLHQDGVRIRFFPVTNQVYCMEFVPGERAGETWLEAQRTDSAWQGVLRDYPPERYVYFFWVAGDSFELFRQLRQSLWDRQIEVGWKPVEKKEPLEVCNGFEGATSFQPQ